MCSSEPTVIDRLILCNDQNTQAAQKKITSKTSRSIRQRWSSVFIHVRWGGLKKKGLRDNHADIVEAHGYDGWLSADRGFSSAPIGRGLKKASEFERAFFVFLAKNALLDSETLSRLMSMTDGSVVIEDSSSAPTRRGFKRASGFKSAFFVFLAKNALLNPETLRFFLDWFFPEFYFLFHLYLHTLQK